MAEFFVAENDFLMPKRHTRDAAGFDFRIKVPGGAVQIEPHQLASFDTGVTLAKTFPRSHCVLLTHRSSSFGKGLLIHSVIDADFPLEIVVCVRNVSDLPLRVLSRRSPCPRHCAALRTRDSELAQAREARRLRFDRELAVCFFFLLFFLKKNGGKKNKKRDTMVRIFCVFSPKNPVRRNRTADLKISVRTPLQSSALTTELSQVSKEEHANWCGFF